MTENIDPSADNAEQATHRVTWNGDAATFHCDGDRTSPCHNYPDCECLYWDLDEEGHHSHPTAPHDDCWLLPWIEAAPEDTWFDGGALLRSMPRVDGEIETEWEGDGVIWCYVKSEELAARGVSE